MNDKRTETGQPLTIQFSSQEIAQIRQFVDQVRSGEIRELTSVSPPVWAPVFLLLRKLLAYGFYYVPQTDPAISYRELQQITTKPNEMLTAVRKHLRVFDQLLDSYVAQQE